MTFFQIGGADISPYPILAASVVVTLALLVFMHVWILKNPVLIGPFVKVTLTGGSIRTDVGDVKGLSTPGGTTLFTLLLAAGWTLYLWFLFKNSGAGVDLLGALGGTGQTFVVAVLVSSILTSIIFLLLATATVQKLGGAIRGFEQSLLETIYSPPLRSNWYEIEKTSASLGALALSKNFEEGWNKQINEKKQALLSDPSTHEALRLELSRSTERYKKTLSQLERRRDRLKEKVSASLASAESTHEREKLTSYLMLLTSPQQHIERPPCNVRSIKRLFISIEEDLMVWEHEEEFEDNSSVDPSDVVRARLVLGIESEEPTREEVVKARKKMAKIFHPDATPRSSEAMKEINAAYDLLCRWYGYGR